MKHRILSVIAKTLLGILAIILSIILLLITSLLIYHHVWGGRPQIENFEDVASDYEIVAQVAIDSYSELKPYDAVSENEGIVINIRESTLCCDDFYLPLTEEQQNAVLKANQFDYLWVLEDAVFFCRDETWYYGLVYSDHPVKAIYKKGLTKSGREYHRINSHWYEWGAFGI